MKIEQLIIPNIGPISSPQSKTTSSTTEETDKGKSFSNVLMDSIDKVNNLQKQADTAIDDLVIGDNKDIVQTMITMEKADISFRLMMQVRNKILQAYEEVMRMQV